MRDELKFWWVGRNHLRQHHPRSLRNF